MLMRTLGFALSQQGDFMCFCTCVVSTVFPLMVSVLPAAALLLQAGAAFSAVTGLPLYLPDANSHRRLAGFGATAPKAPLAHCTVLSWMHTFCDKKKKNVLRVFLCGCKQSNPNSRHAGTNSPSLGRGIGEALQTPLQTA